jgi:CHAT domain-containing protein
MSSGAARWRVSLLLAIGLECLVLSSCRTSADAANVSRLDATFYSERFALGRLAGGTTWQACRPPADARVTCAAPVASTKSFGRLAAASRSARQRLDTDSSADALHAAALLALRLRDSVSTGLDDAARFLARARRVAPTSAPILNDFAVVQLELGERDQTVKPFLSALDAIERALAVDSTDKALLYNRALVLERLHLLATGQRAWARYLVVERDSAWVRDARSHMAAVAHEAQSAVLPEGGRSAVFQLLGDWGRAIQSHDDARAATALETVHGIVATLDSINGDQSARLAVATVDSQVRLAQRFGGKSDALSRLAAAHVDYTEGFLAYRRPKYEEADALLGRAEEELRASHSAAAGWAELFRASAELNVGKYDESDQRLSRLVTATPAWQPALTGKAVWTRGLIEGRRGNFESAIRSYATAAASLTRAREPENEGAISYLISESLSAAGQYAAGSAEAIRGLRLLAPYRKSVFLNNHLWAVASYARADTLPYAALAVMAEVLSVALDLGSPAPLGLTYQRRARDLAAVGYRDSALTELASAVRTIEPLTGRAKESYRADIDLVLGRIERERDPVGALPLLARVASDYDRLGAYWKASAALYETAMAAREAGDTGRARELLASAIAQIERQQTTLESSEGRAALFETADNAFDAMVDLELRAGHPDSAFIYLERERAAAKLGLDTAGSHERSIEYASLNAVRAHLPAGMLFVEYALLSDRAIAWTVSRRGARHFVIPTPRDSIAKLVRRFANEASIPTSRDGDARSQLFDLLVRPLASELTGVDQISFVCDRELSRVPFAALWDRQARRYLIERYQVKTQPSAAFFIQGQGARRSALRKAALVVGNPVLDTSSARLAPLPGAELEARHVAGLYPSATLLIGRTAEHDTVLSLLRTSQVFHFAGHAVFNGDRPELSYLALAASPNGSAGAVTAKEIGELKLTNLQIVVLSACETLSARTTRTGGVAGLASSFLRAGSPAIISTLWDVSDAVTEPLLTEFHRRFAAGIPAAEALQEAQLEFLKSRGGQRTAPALWAAFVYAGP